MSAATAKLRRPVRRRRVMLAVVILVAAGLGSVQVAQAAVAVTGVPCSVTALAAAVSSATSGETLSLASRCTYHLTAGLPVISQDLAILGNGATLERSYAPGTPAFTILQADDGALTVTKLNFRNGNGAIAITHDATLTVNGGTFTRNTAADGGAISNNTGFNGPHVNDATFIANAATDSGGAIYNFTGRDGAQVTNSTFTGNQAANTGGAIYDFSFNNGFVSGGVFYRNKAEYAGALFIDPNSNASVGGVVVRDNSATADGGGALVAYGTDIDGTFSGNHAGGQGGGVYAYDGQGMEVGGDFSGNSAEDGGAISTFEGQELDVGGVFSGNSAEDGGAIYNQDFSDYPLELGGTISGNHASAYGGGVYNQGTVDAVNTEITRNSAATGGGGIYDHTVNLAYPAVTTLTNSSVLDNMPDNCEPANSITGCTNVPAGPIVSGYHKTKCIDDLHGSRVNDTKIVMWDCNDSIEQNWTIETDGTIQTNGKCMDVYRDEKMNKAPVELWTCTRGANQQWEAHNGTLVNPVSGKCLDDPRFNTTDGTQLQIYTCNGGRNQQWKLP